MELHLQTSRDQIINFDKKITGFTEREGQKQKKEE